jgi:hypothetical protein
MESGDPTPLFTDREVELISKSLSDKVIARRLELLPSVLRDWGANELQRYRSEELPAQIRDRVRRLKEVGNCAGRLLQALKTIDKLERIGIAFEIVRAEGQPWPPKELIQRIEEENGFLAKLAVAAPAAWKRGRGRPRNISAYLVMMDAAAIFEWVTKIGAERIVDRDSGTEGGPFFQFVAALWPVVFGKGDDGLSAAMKNWAANRKRHGESSALIVNIEMRKRTWGLFKD